MEHQSTVHAKSRTRSSSILQSSPSSGRRPSAATAAAAGPPSAPVAEGDKYLEAAGCNRDWPHGRGIYYNGAKTALVWVNEEDELRIISMQKGSGFLETFSRFALMVNTLEQHLEFAFDPSLGYLSSCPTNLGTAMRASVHVKLPKLLASGRLNDLGKKYGLSIRGIHGEHSKSVGGIVDISNTQRLGITEVEGVTKMYQGLVHLLKEEDKA
jgi:creatine kinase/arginine kinase